MMLTQLELPEDEYVLAANELPLVWDSKPANTSSMDSAQPGFNRSVT